MISLSQRNVPINAIIVVLLNKEVAFPCISVSTRGVTQNENIDLAGRNNVPLE